MDRFLLGNSATWILENKAEVPTDKKDLDQQISVCIYTSISEEYQYLVEGLTSGLVAWKAVLQHFQKTSISRRLKARQEFYHVTHDPTRPIDVYIHAIISARSTLQNLGCTIEDTETTGMDVLLMNLHPDYHTIRTSILTAKDEPTLDSVKSILTGASVSAIVTVKQEPTGFALAAQGRRGFQSGNRSHGQTRSRSPQGSSQRGNWNFQSGHSSGSKSDRPPSRQDDKGFRWCDPTNERHCHRCGRSGHIAALCIYDMPQHIKDWVMNNPSRSSDGANMAASDSGPGEHAGFASHTSGLDYDVSDMPIFT